MRRISYADTEFDYFRAVLKTPRRSIRGRVVEQAKKVFEFPTNKVSLKASCLIIDKEQSEAALVVDALEQYGFDKDEIIVEATGARAMQSFLGNECIKIVITDLDIPEMNGLQIIKAIRTNHLYAQVHMIILSSKISKQVVEYASAYKTLVMAKPFNQERLVQLLDSICINKNDVPQEEGLKESFEGKVLEDRVAELETLLAQANEEIKRLQGLLESKDDA